MGISASIYLHSTNMNHMDLSDNFLSDNFPSAKLWNSSALFAELSLHQVHELGYHHICGNETDMNHLSASLQSKQTDQVFPPPVIENQLMT